MTEVAAPIRRGRVLEELVTPVGATLVGATPVVEGAKVQAEMSQVPEVSALGDSALEAEAKRAAPRMDLGGVGKTAPEELSAAVPSVMCSS